LSAAGFAAVLRGREFRLLWLADAQSLLGDQLGRVALSVLVYDRTGSGLVTAVVYTRVDPLWPLRPTCGDHALFVEPYLGEDAFRVCPRSGLPIAEVGRL